MKMFTKDAWNFILKFLFCTNTMDVWYKCNKAVSEIIACQNLIMLLGSSRNMAKVVHVLEGENVSLFCNFCTMEKTNYQGTAWYYKQRGRNDSTKEIRIAPDLDYPKISISADQTLKLHNFKLSDSGIYTCELIDRSKEENLFTYVLDGIFYENVMPIIGTMDQWQEYKRTKLEPLNEMFERSQKEPFATFRNIFSFSFRLITSWESWGPCVVNDHRKGIRKKLGKCCLHPISRNKSKEIKMDNPNILTYQLHAFYKIDNYDVSCRSLKLNEHLPEISQIVRYVPDYSLTKTCNIVLNDSATLLEYALLEKENDYKYQITKQIAENGHFTLTCPEVTLDSNIQWQKDMKILNSSLRNNIAGIENEPHISIDSYSLFILHATKNEEGIYSCTVDGIKMQKFNIKVVAKSKLLNDEFIRYSIYLGFVFALTMTCYCSGIIVAWHRRTSFADPLNINSVKNYRRK